MYKQLALLAGAAALTACTTYSTQTYRSVVQKYAVLQTEGVSIQAVDSNWQLNYGQPVMPPRYHDSTKVHNLADGYVTSISGGAPTAQGITPDYQVLSNDPQFAKDFIDVKIRIEGFDKPFNGKMLFSSAREDVTETSAKRAWSVAIPQEYINIAKNGQIAVVYQPADVSTSHQDIATWALWFSSLPL